MLLERIPPAPRRRKRVGVAHFAPPDGDTSLCMGILALLNGVMRLGAGAIGSVIVAYFRGGCSGGHDHMETNGHPSLQTIRRALNAFETGDPLASDEFWDHTGPAARRGFSWNVGLVRSHDDVIEGSGRNRPVEKPSLGVLRYLR